MLENVKAIRVSNAELSETCFACRKAYPRMYAYYGRTWCTQPGKVCRDLPQPVVPNDTAQRNVNLASGNGREWAIQHEDGRITHITKRYAVQRMVMARLSGVKPITRAHESAEWEPMSE